ncbi:hypothetical protein M9H77_34537 [Catharanthus roseus]|uniref:Uncharacterized protein n=1 Tax=Catharanthus roseus TaxID=4058 RepID=A0ACB9ZLG2_CATRO|nr:hypothetical protein M9H77_34537 [Catharanthus roseus]
MLIISPYFGGVFWLENMVTYESMIVGKKYADSFSFMENGISGCWQFARFWSDVWLGNGRLKDLCPLGMDLEELRLSIESCYGTWEDIPKSNGQFSAQSVLQDRLGDPPTNQKQWELMWKYKGPQQFSLFLWQLRHRSLIEVGIKRRGLLAIWSLICTVIPPTSSLASFLWSDRCYKMGGVELD